MAPNEILNFQWKPKVWGEIFQFFTSQSPLFWDPLFGWAPISLQAWSKPSIKFELFNRFNWKFPCISCVIRATHLLQKTNPGIRIPWFIRAGYKNVLPGFSWTFFVATCMIVPVPKPPWNTTIWQKIFGTFSKHQTSKSKYLGHVLLESFFTSIFYQVFIRTHVHNNPFQGVTQHHCHLALPGWLWSHQWPSHA